MKYDGWSFRQKLKRDPEIAAARADLCALYRDIRKLDPMLARLTRRRFEGAVDVLKAGIEANLYGVSANQTGGLNGLLA